jgi:protocatechuate 3,4-dioxygenase beta subunit
MTDHTRRTFLREASLGLAATTGGALLLRADAFPTRSTAEEVMAPPGVSPAALAVPPPASPLVPTRPVVAGPFYRPGAPYRAKSTRPFETGTVLVLAGHVWGFDSRRPVAGAVLDLWHVDVKGKYSAGDGDFKNRARILTDESGAYELEGLHPVAYQPAGDGWRCPHIHLMVEAAGYERLITEIYFHGDPHQKEDSIFHPSLSVPAQKRTANGQSFETATFDIVLERA